MIWAALSIVLGGVLKGATGAGAPIFAIPALTIIYDVPTAVTVLVVPNLLSNLWQAWAYRRDLLSHGFVTAFALAGVAGVVAGSILLAWLPGGILSLAVAGSVLAYIALRLLRPGAWLPPALASRLVIPAGLLGGALQGATGLSAPASLSFLGAMRLERPQFIATISVFFFTMTAAQAVSLVALGMLDGPRLLAGAGALALLVAGMPLGARLGRQLSAAAFDKIIIGLLGLIALRIIYSALTASALGG